MIGFSITDARREEEARGVFNRKNNFEFRGGFLDYCRRLARWDIQWRAAQDRLNKPWVHASDYNPPITFSRTEDLHAVLYSFFSTLNFFSMVPSQAGSIAQELLDKRAQTWTDLLRWSMMNQSNTVSFLDNYIHDGITFGAAFAYMPWLRMERTMRTEHFVPQEIRDTLSSDHQIVKAALGAAIQSRIKGKPSRGLEFRFIDDDGQEKEGKAWVDREHPLRPKGEPVVVLERSVVYYDAPRPRLIAPWDMMVPAEAKDLQTCRRFWVRDFLDWADLHRAVDSGIFNAASKDILDMMEERSKRQPTLVSTLRGAPPDVVDLDRDVEFGLSKLRTRQDQWELIYEYAFDDIDGDGYEESVIRAIVLTPAPHLLMLQRLEYLYPHGRRPFFDWHLFPVSHRYYGMGLPEVLERSQNEANAFYQARSDMVEILSKPAGIYDPLSGLSPTEIQMTPGLMIKGRDPRNAFAPLVFPGDPSILLREQSGIELQTERVSGSTDMGSGRGPTRPNAPRTYGGTALMVRQQQIRSDVYIRRVLWGNGETTGGVAEFLQQYHQLYSAFMPDEVEFRALGSRELTKVTRAELQGRYAFEFDFGDVSNPQLKAQNAITQYQMALGNPLIVQNPKALWKITTNFLEATGMRNADRILPAPMPMDSHPPMDQEEEFAVLAKGIYLDPLMNDDHAAHLAAISELVQDLERLSMAFSATTIPLLERHAARHNQLAMAMASSLMRIGGGMGSVGGNAGASGRGGLMPPSPGSTQLRDVPRETFQPNSEEAVLGGAL